MRPCRICGNPIANHMATCPDCHMDEPQSMDNRVCQEPPAQSTDADDRRDSYRFLLWSFAVLLILVPAIGYLLGGPVFGIIYGVLGALIFGLLVQVT